MPQSTPIRRRLIVNADDFGFSPAVTDGILRCFHEGILTSTTLMTTMPDRERAIALAKPFAPDNAQPGRRTLGIGIHLCLTQGTPLTPCRGILNPDGTFPRSLTKF